MLAVLLLPACATVPRPVAASVVDAARGGSFSLEGRMAVRKADQSMTTGLSWRHGPRLDELLLTGPLGQGLAEIRQDASGAQLTTADGRSMNAPDATELSERVLGFALPIDAMPGWVRASPGLGAKVLHRDSAGRPASLTESGWTVRYLEYTDGVGDAGALPRRLVLENGDVEVKLVIDAWNSLP